MLLGSKRTASGPSHERPRLMSDSTDGSSINRKRDMKSEMKQGSMKPTSEMGSENSDSTFGLDECKSEDDD